VYDLIGRDSVDTCQFAASPLNAVGIMQAEGINLQRPASRLNSPIRLRISDFALMRARKTSVIIPVVIERLIALCKRVYPSPLAISNYAHNYEGCGRTPLNRTDGDLKAELPAAPQKNCESRSIRANDHRESPLQNRHVIAHPTLRIHANRVCARHSRPIRGHVCDNTRR